jgi:quinoprotein glucose dehydrogenase/quinate dehydrogenase (quinone)
MAHPPLKEGETFPRNSPNFWSVASADPELGLVYLPTGNTPPDYIAYTRSEAQHRYNSSIVALDARTGDVRWSFQTTHRDVWDYDIGSQPVLVDLPTPNGVQKALIAPTKVGEIFLLDRATGKPLAEVVEKPVPQDPVPGEILSPTQPFSVGMPSFTPPDLREASMWGATPFDQLWCRIQFRRFRYDGLYTPVTTERTIVFPSPMGTIDWGSVAVDPERRVMIVNSTGVPFVDRLIPREEAKAMGIRPYSGFDASRPDDASSSHLKSLWAQEGTPYAVEFLPFLSPLKIPCHQPPWGEIAAVDLDTRKTLWRRSLGNTRDHALFGIPFNTGMLNLGGAVVTRGRVAFIAATADHYLRAFNVDTGEELWRAGLPAGGQANPMSYVSRRSGRQYVVIAAGGHGTLQTRMGDYVLAYALPQ